MYNTTEILEHATLDSHSFVHWTLFCMHQMPGTILDAEETVA